MLGRHPVLTKDRRISPVWNETSGKEELRIVSGLELVIALFWQNFLIKALALSVLHISAVGQLHILPPSTSSNKSCCFCPPLSLADLFQRHFAFVWELQKDRAATRVNLRFLVPVMPLQLCSCSMLLLGNCVPPAWPHVPVCFLSAELNWYLKAAYWLLPAAVTKGNKRKDTLATVGPGSVFDSVSSSESLMESVKKLLVQTSSLASLCLNSCPCAKISCTSLTCLPYLLMVRTAILLQYYVASVAPRCAVTFKVVTWRHSAVLGS